MIPFERPSAAELRADAAFELVVRLCIAVAVAVPAIVYLMKG